MTYKHNWEKQGRARYTLVFSLADIPMPGPFVLVPVPAGADADAISRVLAGLNMESTLVKDSVVAGGSKSTIERLKNLNPSPRPDLAAALGAIPNATAVAVLVPGADQRRVLEETLPKLPVELGGGPTTIVFSRSQVGSFRNCREAAHGCARHRSVTRCGRRQGTAGRGCQGHRIRGQGRQRNGFRFARWRPC